MYRKWHHTELFYEKLKIEVDQVGPTSIETKPCSFTLTKKLTYLLCDSLAWICQSAMRATRATTTITANCLTAKQTITEKRQPNLLEGEENPAQMVGTMIMTDFVGHLDNISWPAWNETWFFGFPDAWTVRIRGTWFLCYSKILSKQSRGLFLFFFWPIIAAG